MGNVTDSIYQVLGRNLRRSRLAAGLTLEALGGFAELSPSYLCCLELGKKKASLASVERLAAALGVNAARLFKNGVSGQAAPALRASAGLCRWSLRCPIRTADRAETAGYMKLIAAARRVRRRG